MKWVLRAAALLICVPVALCAGSVLFHNVELAQLQNRVGGLRHPARSQFGARYGTIGNRGNGNHLDYWAAELRASSLPRNSIERNYTGQRVAVPHAEDEPSSDVKNGTQPVEIEFLPSPLPAHYHIQNGGLDSWDVSRFAGQRGLYVVEIVNFGGNDGADTFFDWRGD